MQVGGEPGGAGRESQAGVAFLFFFSFFFLSNYILLNLFIAVILDNFAASMREQVCTVLTGVLFVLMAILASASASALVLVLIAVVLTLCSCIAGAGHLGGRLRDVQVHVPRED